MAKAERHFSNPHLEGSEEATAYDEWVATRPQKVRNLIDKFPLGTIVVLDGEPHLLLGYTEAGQLMLSPMLDCANSEESFLYAGATCKYVCADHFTHH